jgi:hypothetical protein
LKYFERKKRERLYRQWVARADLPADAIPPEAEEPSGHRGQQPIDSEAHRHFGALFRPHGEKKLTAAGISGLLAGIDRRLLYGLLILFLVIFWLGVIVLFVNKCS